MPVTFHPAPHNAIEAYTRRSIGCSPASLLEAARKDIAENKIRVREHLQSSFGRDSTQSIPIAPTKNGFVDTVVEAYSKHHALVIRPDDVWICIITQFSLFVNGEGRAEKLRHLFVEHEGKKELEVRFQSGSRYTVDFGMFAALMTDLIHENVVDSELQAWCLPDFSTTTPNDVVVASVIMMATLKAYFEYYCTICCGLPRVTLLGTQDDWLRIYHRIDKLARYGPETAAWRDMLRPVLARFVKAFEPGYADSAENIDFWQHVAHVHNGGSGPDFLSGWITAFCAFDDKGRWVGKKDVPKQSEDLPVVQTPALSSPASQSENGKHAAEKSKARKSNPRKSDPLRSVLDVILRPTSIFHRKPGAPELEHIAQELPMDYTLGKIQSVRDGWYGQQLQIDGVQYHAVDLLKVPIGYAEVDVKLDDNGEKFDTVMVAGLVGTSVNDAEAEGGALVKDAEISPVAAWWMFIV